MDGWDIIRKGHSLVITEGSLSEIKVGLQLHHWDDFCPGSRQSYLIITQWHSCQKPAKLMNKSNFNNTQMKGTASA